MADAITFDVAVGVCLGVIGPNGAGKSSLFNILDGSVKPDDGQILLDGIDITHLPRHKRARAGIGRAHQIPKPFVDLTVFENVLVAATFGAGQRDESADAAAADILYRLGLRSKGNSISGSLTLMDRKRLELAKAMAVGAKVLLLDEIAGGLTDREVHVLVEIVRMLKTDRAVIWIEHVAHALTATADQMIVLHYGRKIVEGAPTAVMQSAEVREIFTGIAVDGAA